MGDPAGKKLHWHIDYLLEGARRRAFCCLAGEPGAKEAEERAAERAAGRSMPVECLWSQFCLALPGAAVILKGFGASDCRSGCAAHLAAFPGWEGQALLDRVEVRRGLAQAAGAPVERLIYRQVDQQRWDT